MNIIPPKLAEQLKPFIMSEQYIKGPSEDIISYGLKCTNIKHHNWRTSGKNISRWISTNYPDVTDRCTLLRLNKIYGTGFGAVIGDALGMPVEFDEEFDIIIKKMYPSEKFNGLLSAFNLPPATFTDDTHMALAIISAILKGKRDVIPTLVAKEFKEWYNSDPIDIGMHTKKVLKLLNKDASNWKEASTTIHNKNPSSAANGAAMRVWPLPILHHYSSWKKLMNDVIIESNITHLNNDAVYSAVFVALLIYKLINGQQLEPAISWAIDNVKDHISENLLNTLQFAHYKKYEDLTGGQGWIVHTMEVVMWSVRNTQNFKDALVAAVNVKGDCDTNASITGAIAGALYGFSNIPSEWLQSFNEPNKYNVWKGKQIDIKSLKDILATLAQC